MKNKKSSRWLFGLVVLMLTLSSITVSGFWSFHLVLHLPWFALVIGATLDHWLNISARQNKITAVVMQGVMGAFLSAAIVGNIAGTIAYHADLNRTGGLQYSNVAIYALADYLGSTYEDEVIFAVDWGISPSVTFLTKGAIQPDEEVGVLVESSPLIANYIMAYLENDRVVFITHSAPYEAFLVRDVLLDILSNEETIMYTVHTINDYQGTPFFEVYEVCSHGE